MSDKIASAVIDDFGSRVSSISNDQERIDYIECTVCMGLAMMRAAGDEYVRGFLEGAINDLDMPSETYVRGSIQ